MFNPAPISPASHASVFHLSPHLNRNSNPVREDSSVEPPALRAARWPSSPIHQSQSSTRRPPRSFTAPANSFSSLRPPPLSFEDDSTSPFDQPRPVQLSPELTPSMRDALPQPKALRPQPPPFQSDLSIASTRAENEPLAVRDLRRVTAPPALMDPWQYDRITNRQRQRERENRKRFVKSMSTTSVVSDRPDPNRDQFSALVEHRRWRVTTRLPHPDRKFLRRRWFNRPDIPLPRIPDRFHDSIDDLDDTHPQKDDSVISAITGDSDPAEDVLAMRWRARSELPGRRSSFALGKEKVMSMWDKLRGRRRPMHHNRHYYYTSDRHSIPVHDEKRTDKHAERRLKFPLFTPVDDLAYAAHGDR